MYYNFFWEGIVVAIKSLQYIAHLVFNTGKINECDKFESKYLL